jgi:hypothetical protein
MPSGEKYDSCGTFGMKLDMARIVRTPDMHDSMSRLPEKRNGCTSFGKGVLKMPRESFFIPHWKYIV